MRGLVPALLIAAVIAAAGPVEPAVTAEPYLLLGIDALAGRDRSAAERYLGAAFELDPGSSDPLYYLARLHAEADVTLAIGLLERSLQRQRFAKAEEAAARIDLASLLLRVGRYDEALAAIDALAPAAVARADPFRVAAAAHLGAGRPEAALSVVQAGLARHPEDASLHLLRARALRSSGLPAREVLDLAAVVVPADAAIAAERALAMIAEGAFSIDAPETGAVRDPRVFAEAFLASPDEARLARFFAEGGNHRVDLLASVAAAAARDPVLRKRFDDEVAGYSGKRWVDENRDSIPEETYEYERGRLRSWIRDANQDLVPDVIFAADVLAVGGVKYEYAPYPFLSRVTMLRGDVAWTFELPPRRVRGPFIEGVDAPAVARLRLLGDVPQEGTLALAARAVTARGGNGARRTWLFEAGVPTSYEEDVNGDGRVEYMLSWRGGRPSLGQRDIDGDGRFDVVERWAERGLSLIEVDSNNNGIVDYAMDFDRGLWTWDYDEDGIPERTVAASIRQTAATAPWPAVVPRPDALMRRGEGR